MINVESEKRVYPVLIAAGMTPEGACALIGNLEAESDGFYSNRLEYLCVRRLKENGKSYTDDMYTRCVDNGTITREEFLHPLPGKQYGYGFAQWTSPTRKAGLYDLCKSKGVSIADENAQIEFLLHELKTTYKTVFDVLKKATSIRHASDVVLKKFEAPADTSEAVCASRAARGQKFYDNYVKGGSKVSVTAKDIIDVMAGWVGMSRAKRTHKPIIDLYNSHKPLARGYEVSYTDDYCDTTVSAAFIKCNAVDLIGGTECGVEEHVKLFQKKGIWQEDGTITPEPGYIIVYNWDDATQPNDGYSDHIGIVESVDKSNKTIIVLEGNMSGGTVGRRSIPIGWCYIRGYAIPAYGAAVTNTTKPNTETGGTYMFTVKTVQKGSTGKSVLLVQEILKANGYKGKNGKALSLDGSCGENTVYAIKSYQKKNGLTVDGIAGQNTLKKMIQL